MPVRWGPFLQHLVLFAILVTCSTVVYYGLRRENVKEIIVSGLCRAGFFVVASLAVFGGVGLLIAQWL